MKLSGPLAPLVVAAFISAGELQCVDPVSTLECWAASGDTTVYYYAETSGLVTAFGIKRVLGSEQLQQTFDAQSAEFTRLHGGAIDCDENGGVQERRWRLADHELVLRAVRPPSGVRAGPALFVVRQLRPTECGDVPQVPYAQ